MANEPNQSGVTLELLRKVAAQRGGRGLLLVQRRQMEQAREEVERVYLEQRDHCDRALHDINAALDGAPEQ